MTTKGLDNSGQKVHHVPMTTFLQSLPTLTEALILSLPYYQARLSA